jgi:hypothetical protein
MAGFADLGEEHFKLGAVGVAEVAARCRARYVLPYAHWWRESGTSDEQESMLAGQLAAALPDGGPVVVDWTIGERLRLQGRGLSRERLF